MCFSLKRTESKNLKNQFKSLVEERRQFSKEKQLTSFLMCMIRFMEAEIAWWLGISDEKIVRGLCSNKKSLNVRPQFVTAFQECSIKQQMIYYQATVKYLTAEPKKEKQEKVISFPLETQGFVKWKKGLDAKFYVSDYKLEIHYPENQKKELHINLRNYIFRKSKQARQYTYVLNSINSTLPKKLCIALISGDRQQGEISKILREVGLQAYISNVVKWREQIVHIKIEKKEIDVIFQASQSSISQKNKKCKQNDLWNEINQKIIKKEEEENEEEMVKVHKKNRAKDIAFYDPLIVQILEKVKEPKNKQQKMQRQLPEEKQLQYSPKTTHGLRDIQLTEKSFHSIEGEFEEEEIDFDRK